MRGANAILLITIGLLALWIVASQKSACLGGFFSCLFGSSSSSTTAAHAASVAAPNPININNVGAFTS